MTRHFRRIATLACAPVVALALACTGAPRPSPDSAASADTVPVQTVPGGAAPGAGVSGSGPTGGIGASDTTRTTPVVPPSAARPSAPATTGSIPRGEGVATPTPAEGGDTLRGIVAEVGSVPVTSIVIRPEGERAVTILGSLAREIGRAAGADVWVRGHRTPSGLVAEQYAVRAVDGQPAVDGIVATEGDGLALVTPAGRYRIARPPQALRGMIGARVWLTGDLNGSITSYGVLRGDREE